MTDCSANNDILPIDFFRVKSLETDSHNSRENMRRAVDSFCAFAGGVPLRFDDFTPQLLGEWAGHQFFEGYAPKTVAYNIKKLAALYSKAVDQNLARPTTAFADIQDRLRDPELQRRFEGNEGLSGIFDRVQRLVRIDCSATPCRQLAKDLLLFSIYLGGLTFEEAASWRKDQYTGTDPHVLDIISRHSRPRNKYLFPLDQIHSTPRQLTRRLAAMTDDLLRSVGLTLLDIPSNTALHLWSACAMRCGVTAADIAACAGPRSTSLAITAFVAPSGINDAERNQLRESVSATLSHNPERWYAMHLRRHADWHMIEQRLMQSGLRVPTVYYPMEEIMRRVGKRKIFESRPVIEWLLFFRERVTSLGRLFQAIGDLAWGYRIRPDLSSPYAEISPDEILAYQTAIGTLSPDVQLRTSSASTPAPGDAVVVIGGVMDGHTAIFQSQLPPSDGGGRTMYRLLLTGGNALQWTIDWDSRLVRKI